MKKTLPNLSPMDCLTLRLLLPSLLVVSALAQTPAADLLKKAPPEVEEALRKRVGIFYQAHVDAKWRVADAVVAEESKDAFFAAPKPKINKFEIVRINWDPDFKKATVVVGCHQDWFLHGEKVPVVTPITTTWRLENNDWYWWVDPVAQEAAVRKTPFGTMTPGPPSGSLQNQALPAVPPDLARAMKDAAGREQILQGVLRQVSFSKLGLTLPSAEVASETIVLKNGSPGEVSVDMQIEGAFAGLTIELDRTKLGANETANILVRHEPRNANPKPQVILRFTIKPTGQITTIPIQFTQPAPQ
jgi:hypothetical protein